MEILKGKFIVLNFYDINIKGLWIFMLFFYEDGKI